VTPTEATEALKHLHIRLTSNVTYFVLGSIERSTIAVQRAVAEADRVEASGEAWHVYFHIDEDHYKALVEISDTDAEVQSILEVK